MYFLRLAATAATIAITVSQAKYIGFNYAATYSNGSAIGQSYFEAQFKAAKKLTGTNGEFTSARLYTMIQGGSGTSPISAIPAAISTETTLLLGIWASAGQPHVNNEIKALKTAIRQYGSSFTKLIAGISVGSEDLYRDGAQGLKNHAGVGAPPKAIVRYISQVRSAIKGTGASDALVGHVDTWTAFVNASNKEVITASDWLGIDAYPYFQGSENNPITAANATFFNAYDSTVLAAKGKPIWITETGWPVSGKTVNQAVPSVENAETYWQVVGCTVFGKINTWWYTLQDAQPTTPNPSFGLLPADLSSAPLYDLACNNSNSAKR